MSDQADTADNKIYQAIADGLAAARNTPSLLPGCYCYFCDEQADAGLLFFNSDCRDDFDRYTSAARRAGKQ